MPAQMTAEHDAMFLAHFLIAANAATAAEPTDLSFAPAQFDAPGLNFCPDEPLCFDDVGEVPDMLTFGQTPCPFGPTPTLQFAPPPELAPYAAATASHDWSSYPLPYDSYLGSMVQNTFIHAAPAPPTPAPFALRRSVSVPKDAGSEMYNEEDKALLQSAIDARVAHSPGSTTARSSSSVEESAQFVAGEGPLKLSLAAHLAF